jgi:CRISPR-associated protein Csx3
MYSYQMRLEGDVLRVGFNRILPAKGDRIVKDAVELLEQMIDSRQLSGGSVLKIDGPQSVPVAYAIGHRLSHLYETIAILDPKIGKKGHKTYIVTITHGSSDYEVGQLIETPEPQTERTIIKVVLCGPPHSGKSCLRDGLKKAILGILGAPYPYVITACPDGEGSWHKEAYKNDEESAKHARSKNKGDFTPEFAEVVAGWVKSANQPINIIDVGGKISDENKQIMEEATHAVILSGEQSKVAEWRNFCENLNLKVIAEIESNYNAKEDKISIQKDWEGFLERADIELPLLAGSVHHLTRTEDVSSRPMVKALANLLVKLTANS